MRKLFGPAEHQRLEFGGAFPCPRCGSGRPYDGVRSASRFHLLGIPTVRLGRYVHSMRCRSCATTYEPLVDGQLNLRQVAEWTHRTDRLVATLGVAAGGSRLDEHQRAAHRFLLDRGWFTAEADGVVGWASEVSEGAVADLLEELMIALGTLAAVSRTTGMEQVVSGLAHILLAGRELDARSAEILTRCCNAAAVDPQRLAELTGLSIRPRAVAA